MPQYDAWAFLKPFGWTIWCALAVTLFVVPILIWVVENLSLVRVDRRSPQRGPLVTVARQITQTGSIPMHFETLHDWRHAIYATLLQVFNLNVLKVKSIGAQTIIVSFAFLNLVVVSLS